MDKITNLTKNIAKKDDRFVLIEDEKGYGRTWEYKGRLTLFTYREEGMTTIAIHLKWDEVEFTSDEWRETAEYELMDMFDRVESFWLNRLTCILDKIIAGVDRLNAKVIAEGDIDMTPVIEKAESEYLELMEVLPQAKALKWWCMKDYDMNKLGWHIRGGEKDLEELTEELADNAKAIRELPRKEKRELMDRYEKGWSLFGRTYIDDLREDIEKYKEA